MHHDLVCEKGNDLLSLFFRGLELIEDVEQMHLHVAFLDTGGHQSPQGPKILGESGNSHDLHQILGRGMAQHFMSQLDHGMKCCEPSNGSERKRQLDPETKAAIFHAAVGQAGIATAAAGIGVPCRFYGTEIISGGDHNCIHSIENALVVGGCPIRFDLRDPNGPLKARGEILWRHATALDEFLHRAFHFGADQTFGRII